MKPIGHMSTSIVWLERKNKKHFITVWRQTSRFKEVRRIRRAEDSVDVVENAVVQSLQLHLESDGLLGDSDVQHLEEVLVDRVVTATMTTGLGRTVGNVCRNYDWLKGNVLNVSSLKVLQLKVIKT